MLFWGIMVLGFLLRIIVHLNGPLNFDEVCSWAFARKTPFMHMWQSAFSDPTPPLFYALVHGMIRLFGENPALMRLPSLVFGILVLPLSYWIMGMGGFQKTERQAAMLIVAVSSMLVFYSQELRAYSMLACCGVLATGLLFACSEHPTTKNYLLYALSLMLLSQAHRYGLLLIPAHFCFTVLLKRWRLCGIVCVTSFLILVTIVLQMVSGNFYYSEAPDRITTWRGLGALINLLNVGTILLPEFFGGQPCPDAPYPQRALNYALSLAGLVTFSTIFFKGFSRLHHFSAIQKRLIFLLAICTGIPIMLAALAGTRLMPKPQWLLRGLIFIWPFYYMLASAACSQVHYKKRALAVIVLLHCLTLYPYYSYFSRGVHSVALAKLSSTTSGQDLIVAYPWYFYEVVAYYYRGKARTAAYSEEIGWVDTDALRAGTTPFFNRSLPTAAPPAVSGDVYFFPVVKDDGSIEPFKNNRIFVYDEHLETEWRLVQPSNVHPSG